MQYNVKFFISAAFSYRWIPLGALQRAFVVCPFLIIRPFEKPLSLQNNYEHGPHINLSICKQIIMLYFRPHIYKYVF